MKADLEMVYLTCSNGYASAMDDGFNRIESYFDDKDLQTLHKRAEQASLGMVGIYIKCVRSAIISFFVSVPDCSGKTWS